jgi:acyl transferase domain-containing protein/acyl carrier protein
MQDQNSIVKDALAKIRALKLEVAELKRQREPIAIRGMACRFPGNVEGDEDFWSLLRNNVDAISPTPLEREELIDHSRRAGAYPVPAVGGFMSRAFDFAAQFFQISPRELEHLDPQQRLLLELTWEALEDACLVPSALRGSNTGVFIGIGNDEYLHLILKRGLNDMGPYVGSGNSHSAAAGRISHVFDFRGPSVSLDTACSSSLVALHMATKSLLSRECTTAIVGSVSCLLSPAYTVGFAKSGMLAADGRCKVFSEQADGYVRSEGCGVVVLQLQSHAERDAAPMRAIVRGTAVNHDGHCSGLTVPNRAQQSSLTRSAVAAAGLLPDDIGYVEAHGTGTALGDPIELHGLADVFAAAPRSSGPLLVGSVKANIGHLEPAAGIAGLIKTVLVLENEIIPAQLHCDSLTSKFAWNDAIGIPRQNVSWPRGARPRFAGVSSFGFSGTNAHVVLEEAPAVEAVANDERAALLLHLSAHSREELVEMTRRYVALLRDAHPSQLADICHTANAYRETFPFRRFAVGECASSLIEALERGPIVNVGRDPAPRVSLQGWLDPVEVVALELLHGALAARFEGYRAEWGQVAAKAAAADDAPAFAAQVRAATAQFLARLGVALDVEGGDWSERAASDLDAPRPLETTGGQVMGAPYRLRSADGAAKSGRLVTAGRVDIEGLLENYCLAGGRLRWQEYYPHHPRRVRLPRYPFARQNIRIGRAEAPPLSAEPASAAKGPLYTEAWRPVVAEAPEAPSIRRWLMLTPGAPDALLDITRRLQAEGHVCELVSSFDDARRRVASVDVPFGIIIHPGHGAYAAPRPEEMTSVAALVLDDLLGLKRLLEEIVARKSQALVWGYSNHPIWGSPGASSGHVLFESPVFGCLRSMRLELPDVVQGIVTCSGLPTAVQFMSYLVLSTARLSLSVCDGVAHEPYLAPVVVDSRPHVRIRSDATYLVTGGSGGVGRHVVRWLLDRGARHVVVTSRRAHELEAAVATVSFYQADVTSEEDVSALATVLRANHPPLAGIVHAAGVNESASLSSQPDARFREIASAKILGSLLLQRHLGCATLDFFAGISSIAGVWGAAKMQAYSAASHFQAQLGRSDVFPWAQYCICYGPWSNTGMVDEHVGRQLQRQGLIPLSIDEGLAGLHCALADGAGNVIDVAADWPRFIEVFASKSSPRFFDRVATVASVQAPRRSEGLDPVTLATVRDLAAAILGYGAGSLDVEAPLHALGMDSILALEFQKELEQVAGQTLPRTLIFDYPTVSEIFRHIGSVVTPSPRGEPNEHRDSTGDIAIIGAAVRAPGASNIDQFWDVLFAERDAISRDVGAELAARAGLPGAPPACPAYHAGLLTGIDLFDADRFNISRREAELMDPQQRLMLELAWHTFENAGYVPAELRGQRCAVFVGTGNLEYAGICKSHVTTRSGLLATSHVANVIPGRIAYYFDLKGAGVAVDTACSSALVAVHQACSSLRSGDCSMALAGGVNLILAPDHHVTLHQANMLSVSGTCSVFDESADGYLRAEAAGFVLLKPLAQALADGDTVLATIRGSAINQDGRSSSLTAPSGRSQQDVIRAALDAARLTPEEIDVVEAHGTGTPLGDPIELQAIDAVYGARTSDHHRLFVTAAKANVGHAEAAAGVISIAKALAVLARRTLPRQVHYSRLNPNARVDESRLCIPRETVRFDADGPLRLAVSSFGFSGTNAHMILESAPLRRMPQLAPRPEMGFFVLSASGELALEELRRQYHGYCRALDLGGASDLMKRAASFASKGPWRTAGVYCSHEELLQVLLEAPAAPADAKARSVILARPRCLPADAVGKLQKVRDSGGWGGLFADLQLDRVVDVEGYVDLFEGCLIAAGVAHAFVERDAEVELTGDVDVDVSRVLVAAYLAGQDLPFDMLGSGQHIHRRPLASYPFARERYWAFDQPSVAQDSGVFDLYQVVWDEDDSAERLPSAAPAKRVVLVVTNDRMETERLSRSHPSGVRPIFLLIDEAQPWADDVIVASDVQQGLARAVQHLTDERLELAAVAYLWRANHPFGEHGLEPTDQIWDEANDGARALLEFTRSVIAQPQLRVPTHVITRFAQSVDGTEAQIQPADALLWGMVNVIRVEYPELVIACVDLDSTDPGPLWREILDADRSGMHAAWRGQRRHVPRIQAVTEPAFAEAPLSIKPDRTYLIAGGLGGLGFEVMRSMLHQGAKHILLIGRSGPSGERERELAELRARHAATISTAPVDITNLAELRRCLAGLGTALPPLAGVIHSAGIVQDRLIRNTSPMLLRQSLDVKARGALSLYQATLGAQLDFFICFSSTTAVLGNIGQVTHAAANAYLDALVQRMRRAGIEARSIAWGPWRDVGVAAKVGSEHFEALGIRPFTTADGVSRFNAASRGRWAQTLAIHIDWSRFERSRAGHFSYRTPGTLQTSSDRAPRAAARGLAMALTREGVFATTRRLVAELLKLEPARVPATKDFHLLGVDSVLAVELRSRCNEAFQHSFNSTLVFDYPNLEQLSRYVAKALGLDAAEPRALEPASLEERLRRELDEVAEWMDEQKEAS